MQYNAYCKMFLLYKLGYCYWKHLKVQFCFWWNKTLSLSQWMTPELLCWSLHVTIVVSISTACKASFRIPVSHSAFHHLSDEAVSACWEGAETLLPLLVLPFPFFTNCALPPTPPPPSPAESGSSLPSSYGSTDEHIETEAPLCE